MYNDLFFKLCSNFDVGWNVDDLIKNFIEDKTDPNAVKMKRHVPYSDLSGAPHFQIFPSNAAFARNLYKNFPNQCKETASRLIELQEKIKKEHINSSLIQEFLDCKISGEYFSIIRVFPGKSITPHFDATRELCLNIGLKNSNLWKTNIYQSTDLRNFQNFPKFTFTMNDNDVYLLKVQNVHSAESEIFNLDKIRYILTYTIKIR